MQNVEYPISNVEVKILTSAAGHSRLDILLDLSPEIDLIFSSFVSLYTDAIGIAAG
jgi:hypothetical protein